MSQEVKRSLFGEKGRKLEQGLLRPRGYPGHIRGHASDFAQACAERREEGFSVVAIRDQSQKSPFDYPVGAIFAKEGEGASFVAFRELEEPVEAVAVFAETWKSIYMDEEGRGCLVLCGAVLRNATPSRRPELVAGELIQVFAAESGEEEPTLRGFLRPENGRIVGEREILTEGREAVLALEPEISRDGASVGVVRGLNLT